MVDWICELYSESGVKSDPDRIVMSFKNPDVLADKMKKREVLCGADIQGKTALINLGAYRLIKIKTKKEITVEDWDFVVHQALD